MERSCLGEPSVLKVLLEMPDKSNPDFFVDQHFTVLAAKFTWIMSVCIDLPRSLASVLWSLVLLFCLLTSALNSVSIKFNNLALTEHLLCARRCAEMGDSLWLLVGGKVCLVGISFLPSLHLASHWV